MDITIKLRYVLLLLMLSSTSYALEKKHIGIFRLVGSSTYEQTLEKAETAAVKLENFYRHVGRWTWDIKVTGYAIDSDCTTIPPYYCSTHIKNYMLTNHPEVQLDYFHVWGGNGNGWCGHGQVNGQWSVTYTHYACGTRTIIHELGHNFGLRHSRIEGGSEYSDSTSIMGGGTSATRGMVSAHLIYLGFYKSLQVITTSQEIIVETSETGHLVKVGKYYLSLRKTKGHPYAVRALEDRLYIHYLDGNESVRLSPDMSVGSTKKLPHGVTIKYLEYEDERARIAIIFNDVVPETIVMPDYLEQQEPLTEEHTGAWYDPDFDGQGFDIQIKGDRAVIYWYTFNQFDNARRYYFGTCLIVDCVFELFTTDKGTFDNPIARKVLLVGSAQVYPEGNKLIIKYDTKDHGVGELETELLAQGVHMGAWYDPERVGSGFTIQIYGERMVAFWYTYGFVKTYPYEIQKQRWYICVGSSVDGIYQLTIYEVLGGKWLQLDKTNLQVVGTATMKEVGELMLFESDLINLTLQKLF